MRRIVDRRRLSIKHLVTSFVGSDTESPRRWIARRETSHDVVVDFGFAHLLTGLSSLAALEIAFVFSHTSPVSLPWIVANDISKPGAALNVDRQIRSDA